MSLNGSANMTTTPKKPAIPPVVEIENADLIEVLNRFEGTMKELIPHVAYLADSAGKIAGDLKGIKGFFTKWGPWILGVAALAYPKLSQWIQSIPLPHS